MFGAPSHSTAYKMGSATLDHMPLELLFAIVDVLPWSGIFALSSTCRNLRSKLGHHVFQAIRIQSDWEENDTSKAIVNKYQPTVKHLHFIGSMPNGRPPEDQGTRPNYADGGASAALRDNHFRSFLTQFARDAICGKIFPSVDSMKLEFDFTFDAEPELFPEGKWDYYTYDEGSVHTFMDLEKDVASAVVKETVFPWRALMLQTWTALCQNEKVKKLTIPALIPRVVSIFYTSEYKQFLGQLEDLDLQMWGGRSPDGLYPTLSSSYRSFERDLDIHIFQHLTSVKRLRFGAHPDTPFGLRNIAPDASFPLYPSRFPYLRILIVRNMLIGHDFAEFILCKSDVLESVQLEHCHSLHGVFQTTWGEFLQRLNGDELHLSDLCINHSESLVRQNEEVPVHSLNSIEEVQTNSGEEVFSYGTFDYVNGNFEVYKHRFRSSTEVAHDVECYNALMETIRRNKSTTTSDP
jgi:hypothetical protein